MTPTKRVLDEGLTSQQKQTLTRLAQKRPKAALQEPGSFLLVAGDNGAESEFGVAKNMLRRQNLFGRVSPAMAHMTVLAGQRLLSSPGLLSVLRAFAIYRKSRKDEIGHGPHAFCDPHQDRAWLWD